MILGRQFFLKEGSSLVDPDNHIVVVFFKATYKNGQIVGLQALPHMSQIPLYRRHVLVLAVNEDLMCFRL